MFEMLGEKTYWQQLRTPDLGGENYGGFMGTTESPSLPTLSPQKVPLHTSHIIAWLNKPIIMRETIVKPRIFQFWDTVIPKKQPGDRNV